MSAVPPVPVLPPPLVRVLHRGQIGSARSEYRGWAVLFALGPLSLSFHCDEFNFPVFPHGRPPPTHGEIVQGAVEECGVVHTLKKNYLSDIPIPEPASATLFGLWALNFSGVLATGRIFPVAQSSDSIV